MGMRRLWLAESSLSQESQQSLLELPFKLGSTLFAGAQAVITEAAAMAAQFKDSKSLLEKPKATRKSPLAGSHPPLPKEKSWTSPMKKRKNKGGKGRGRGRGAGGPPQQQSFRPGGKSS